MPLLHSEKSTKIGEVFCELSEKES